MPDNAKHEINFPVAFYFKVTIGGPNETTDTSFQEVSGISTEIEVESFVEGGENRYTHQLPKGIKHANLELKRAISPKDSALVKWCIEVMEGDFAKPIEILLNYTFSKRLV